LRDTVLPNLAAGAARAGRDPADLEVIVPAFIVVGDTDEEQHRWRELARIQVSFYGSTPNYGFIFEQLGYEDTTPRIREKQKAGDIAGMAAVISDDLLEHFITSGTWDSVASAVVERYRGIATRVVSYFSGFAADGDPESLLRWGEVARAVTSS
jgi:alkanesulfonate monooxygenase SsuD/methylene tetrahydromethanopterin reductase-like flavin-dependent oxidoreductase (luciferase family)